jgi:hypothetical protein
MSRLKPCARRSTCRLLIALPASSQKPSPIGSASREDAMVCMLLAGRVFGEHDTLQS